MANIKFSNTLWLVALMILSGCVSEFHANVPFADENILVVEGDIIANTEVDITLSKTFGLDFNKLPEDYNHIDATVHLVGSDGSNIQAVGVSNGVYRLQVGELHDDVLYSIEIQCEGQKYASEPDKPLTTPEISDLNFSQPVNEGEVSIRVSTHSDDSGFSYFMWDYIEDWEYTSKFQVLDVYNPLTYEMEHLSYPEYYYCWRNRRGKEILLGSTESYTENKIINQQLRRYGSLDERFDYLYSIRLKQIAITKKSYEYYQNRAKMSEDMGGLFTPQPSELIGNVKCITDESRKVIGYINFLKNVTEKQLYIKSSEIKKPWVVGCFEISKQEADKRMKEMMMGYHEFYLIGHWPLDGKFLHETSAWAEADCVDCTRKGGTKNKPEWWPNNHR